MILEYARMEAVSGEVSDARRLYELAVTRFPGDPRGWEQYLDFERRRGGAEQPARAAALVSRRNQLLIRGNLGKEIPPHTSRAQGADEGALELLW